MATHTGKFVAYFRVSTSKQGNSGLGLEAQRAAVANYLNGGKWKLVGEFEEVESGKRSDRPELDKALAACRLHKAKLVVAKVDRLTRSAAFLHRMLESGVEVRFCDLPQIEGPTGKFLLQQMASVAELEAGMISVRTKAALAAAKARGTTLGGNRGATLTAEQSAMGRSVLVERANRHAVRDGEKLTDGRGYVSGRHCSSTQRAWHSHRERSGCLASRSGVAGARSNRRVERPYSVPPGSSPAK